MGSMTGWMMGLGGLATLLVLILVVGGVIWLVVTLARAPGPSDGSTRTAAQIALAVLAVVGAVALVAATAMGVMHIGMGCCG